MNSYKRNRLLQNIIHPDRSGNKQGYVKIHSNNSDEHEFLKFKIAHKLKRLGFEIWSECEFVTGGKADLIAIRKGIGYILEIETPKSKSAMKAKILSKKKYPSDFELIIIETDKFKIEEFLL